MLKLYYFFLGLLSQTGIKALFLKLLRRFAYNNNEFYYY